MMAADRRSYRDPASRAPEGMAGGAALTLLMPQAPPNPLDMLERLAPPHPPAPAIPEPEHLAIEAELPAAEVAAPEPASPEGLALHCTRVPFLLGGDGLTGFAASADAPASRPLAGLRGGTPGATLSAGGSRLAADRVPEIRVVSPLPADADSITIQPNEGSAVLAIAVRDTHGLHPVPLLCADVLSGGWKLEPDRLGRICWHSGEARLRLPPIDGPASVEVTLVAI